MELLIKNQQDKTALTQATEELLEKIARAVAEEEKPAPDPEVSLLLVDDEGIRELNRSYRGLDQPTDVLSFALNEDMPGEENFISLEEDHLLGDVVISLETAARQAEEYGHSFGRELGFLLIHGMLHLLGYDHGTEEDREEMRQKEEKILAKLGLTR